MKVITLWGICLLGLSAATSAEPTFLIRIDQVDQATINRIKHTEIEVYAKTFDFWIAGATGIDLNLLAKQGVAFDILDAEADMGQCYLVRPRPAEKISAQLERIRAEARVLFYDDHVAVVKGDPRKVEKLASVGFSLRKIPKKQLPVEPARHAASYLESFSPAYDPLIGRMVNQVDQTQLLSWVDDLSGEDTVLIGGVADSIKTRYSYSDGTPKAAHYLKERFEEMGIPAEFDTFQVSGFPAFFVDLVCSPDGQKAWSVNNYGYGGIMRTTDGGVLWELIDGTQHHKLHDVCRVDDDTLWCVGSGGNIIRSTDRGDTWEDRSTPQFGLLDFGGCYFEDALSGWVVGDEKVLYTSDGGTNWAEQAQVPGVRLYAADFVDLNRGWIVGEDGTVIQTTDRGANWNAQSSGTSVHLRSVDFIDQFSGWACGDDGWAIYTTDAGANWIQKVLPTSADLKHVFFVDHLHGWMVGLDGSVLRTSDLGVNWLLRPTGGSYMYGIGFADTLIGWASGQNEIVKTTDGGQRWHSDYQNFEGIELTNVVATLQGSIRPQIEVLITAHYDDVSEDPYNWAPGADDDASGTVSLLAAAAILKGYGLTNTVRFVGFSCEEQGHLGSLAYAEEAYDRGDSIVGVLNFDMIAWDGNGDEVIELHCGEPSANQALADLMIGAISEYGLNLNAQKITSGATDRSDHASFWDYGYPAILGIEDFDDFNPYYHSTGDRVSAFDVPYYVDFTKAAVAGISILADPYYMLGDANGDALIDLGDALFLLNYLFKSGFEPDPLEAGDANSDGMVDLADAIYLLNYLFKGGPPPSG